MWLYYKFHLLLGLLHLRTLIFHVDAMDPDGSSYTRHLLSSAFCQALYYVFLPFVIGTIEGGALKIIHLL